MTKPKMIEFFVQGKPEPCGSKDHFPCKNNPKRIIVVDTNPKAKDWKRTVAHTGQRAMIANKAMLTTEHVAVDVMFYIRRPKSHYRTGKYSHELKPSAPFYPTSRPDTTKLWRAAEDALTGVIWKDDAQVIDQLCRKRFVGHYEPELEGVLIKITMEG